MRRRGGMKKGGKIALTAQRITRDVSASAGPQKMMRGPSQRIGRGKARPQEVREVLARHGLMPAQEKKVLAALMAQKTIAGRRQDQWAEAAQDTLDLVYGYILAARARQTAAFAAAPIEGHA